jgi:predicted  nucleic acid-binding Zn-ribbon protein
MTELTLELLREELAPIRAEQAAIRAELAAIRAELAAMRPLVNGIPLIQRVVSAIQQEQRMLKSAINDLARVQFTSGEAEALHGDVNTIQSTHLELETRIVTLEQRVRKLENAAP